MVQLFHYESVGAKCKKLIGRQASAGQPIRVALHADDACGAPCSSAHWLLNFPLPWLAGVAVCRVTEFGSGGLARRSCWAKVTQEAACNLIVRGRFGTSGKQAGKKKIRQPNQQRDFLLSLTTRVSEEDFQRGYSMTGWLQTGNGGDKDQAQQWRVTHAAMVRRQDY